MLHLALPSFRGLPRVFWLLWAGSLINRLGNFVLPFLALYLTQERGVTVESAGLTATLFGAGAMAAAPLGGILADRVGRRFTMVAGLTLGAVAMLNLGLARTPLQISVAALLLGVFGDLYRPAVWAAVADVVPPADRARAFGLLYWAINLGFAVAGVLAGLLAARGYWVLFIGDALTSLAMAAVIFIAVPETRPAEAIGRTSHFADALFPFQDGVFMSFIALSFLTALLFMQHSVALPLDMRNNGLSPRDFGLLIAINGILIVLLQPSFSRLVAHRRRSRVLAFSALLVGVGFGMTAYARTPAGYGWSIAVWSLGEIIFSPVVTTIVADLSPTALRGTYQGVQQLSWSTATCLAPALGSQVLGHYGGPALWLGCFAIGVTVAAGHLLIAGARRRRLGALAFAVGGD